MKLQLLSDLHLENAPERQFEPNAGADVLVLAGDIGSYQTGSRLPDADRPYWGLERFSPSRKTWPTPVLFVPGNHEYDGLEWAPTRQRLQNVCAELGIHWLDQETQVIDGVRFIGCTLWSDFDSLTDPQAPMTQQLQQRHKAFRAANWYLHKNSPLINGQRLLADGIRELGLSQQAWLSQALQTPFEGPTVVVTHFAPSLRSADPRYGTVPGTAGFCNALDHLLPHATLWLHGHVHCRHDYLHHGCRVIAHPLGYVHKNEQMGFDPGALWELPTSVPRHAG